MSELKIPIYNKSRQYLFKNKLTIKRKSKTKLLRESLLMFLSSLVLIYLNYLIPQKKDLIYSFFSNFYNIYLNSLIFFKYFYQIVLVFIIFITGAVSLILFIGGFYRIYKISRRKTKKFKF